MALQKVNMIGYIQKRERESKIEQEEESEEVG